MMDPVNHIRYLTRKEIDIYKWDNCIDNAVNGLIYARSFYLDTMAENWSALIEGDYNRVMPLTWNKKFGLSYLYQPYFTKTLGVFGNGSIPFEISGFLKAIPKKYRYWDIDINESNFISDNQDFIPLQQHARANYFLSLQQDYVQISLGYKRLAKRMKKKAVGNRLQIIKGTHPASIIRLYRQDYNAKHPGIGPDIYKRLISCTGSLFENKQADTYLALSSAGETLAYYLILTDKYFIYSLLGGSTAEGKRIGAFYLLTDAIIQDHAGTGKTFRFEGSDIPGISFFNALFGPVAICYQHLKMNGLPFPFNLLK